MRDLERILRTQRPRPADPLVAAIAGRLRPRPRAGARFGFAGALTAAMLVAVSAVGGVSYAATAAHQAVRAVRVAVAPTSHHAVHAPRTISAGGDQYRPGYGFGDPNHNHTGPPGIKVGDGDDKKDAAAVEPEPAKPVDRLAKTVGATVTFDEQAHLYVSVIDSRGEPLLLTQRSKRGGTSIGGGALTGPQTKFIQYVVRVPRAIPMNIRVPENLVKPGERYRIRIVAIDAQGNKSTAYMPFSG